MDITSSDEGLPFRGRHLVAARTRADGVCDRLSSAQSGIGTELSPNADLRRALSDHHLHGGRAPVARESTPRSLGLIPLAWTVVGGSAAFILGVHVDLALLLVGAVLLVSLVVPRRGSRAR